MPSPSKEIGTSQNLLCTSLTHLYILPVCHWLRHFSLFYSCYSSTYFSEIMLTQFLTSLLLSTIIFLFNLLFFLPLLLHNMCDVVFLLLKKTQNNNLWHEATFLSSSFHHVRWTFSSEPLAVFIPWSWSCSFAPYKPASLTHVLDSPETIPSMAFLVASHAWPYFITADICLFLRWTN